MDYLVVEFEYTGHWAKQGPCIRHLISTELHEVGNITVVLQM